MINHARSRWARAVFHKLLAAGHAEGWVSSTCDVESTIVEPPASDVFALLRERFELSRSDTDALWLLACCELDPMLVQLAHTLGNPDVSDLSVATWSRLVECAVGVAPSARVVERLDRLALIETTWDPKLPLHRRWIRVADRVVDLARGEVELDREVAMLGGLVLGNATDLQVGQELAFALDQNALILAIGPSGSGRATQLEQLALSSGRGVLRIEASRLPVDGAQLARTCRGVAREARLFNAIVMIRDLDDVPEPVLPTIERELLGNLEDVVLATSKREVPDFSSRSIATRPIAPPAKAVRKQIWGTVLPSLTDELREQAANAYSVTPGTIVAAAASVKARIGHGGQLTMVQIHEGLRAHLDRQLGSIASRVTCKQTWDDLVLPVDQFEQVAELVSRVRHRRRVLEDWGFGRKVGRGFGVAALMSGPPGTGKTMVAGLIANELGLDLYQVDLSKVVSKYIGETEKNLATVFDAAESGHAVILFDEADSLFGKRTDVKSSNDRYANLEVNYLLQRIDQFSGISLLTTNHESAIDEAFRRRLALHIRLPLPDEEQRLQLWQALLSEDAPVRGELELRTLARDFAMTGGYIKNAVLRAAYLAARDGAITARHLERAARAEYAAMGKLVMAAT